MQSNSVKRYRQLLVRNGFYNISIYSNYRSEVYTVYATKLINGKIVDFKEHLTELEMDSFPRCRYINDDY